MTPDERATQLRAELDSLNVPDGDITRRLLDRVSQYTHAVDIDCMRAVDEILSLRDQVAACRTIIENTDAEIVKIRKQVETLRDMLPEEVTDV